MKRKKLKIARLILFNIALIMFFVICLLITPDTWQINLFIFANYVLFSFILNGFILDKE